MNSQLTTYFLALGLTLGAASKMAGQLPEFRPIDFPEATATQTWGMNPRGEIVGSYNAADKSTHGFLLNEGRFTTIDYPGATSTVVAAINPGGDIAGQYVSPDKVTHGFVLRRGVFTTVDYPDARVTSPGAMNAQGDIAGGYTAQDGTRHGYLYSQGKFTTIDYPGASTTVPSGINARGDVVGGYMIAGVAHGFLLRNGQFSSYEFPGGTSTQAYAISARGEIAGRYVVGGVTHGFVLQGVEFTTIDYPGASYTAAYFINTTDDLLGQYQVDGVTHSYLLTRRVRHDAHYSVKDLGTLGGSFSIAFGINDAGVVAGGANVSSENQHPFLWSAGKMTDLGTPGGPNANVGGPNGSLMAAGLGETSGKDPNGEDFCALGSNLICSGFLWQNGTVTQLLPLGGSSAMALNLNNRGQAVGIAETNVRDASCGAPQVLRFEAVVWGPGANEIQMLAPLPGDTVGFALANNDKGQVVGSTGVCGNTQAAPFALGPHAVMWDHGSPVALGSLGGKTAAAAASVNNRSEVVGGSLLADEKTFNTYLWTRAMGMIDVGTVEDDRSAYPGMINDSGQVVGTSCDTGSDGNCRAYIWQYLGPDSPKVEMVDLNSLVASDTPYDLVSANAINNAGEIVGLAVDRRTGEPHAFLATPGAGTTAVSPSMAEPWRIPEQARKAMRSKMR